MCSLAHAEINALTRVPFRDGRELVLTTTLEPCLQCAAAIRLAKIATVRFAGADSYWSGCHEFQRVLPDEAARAPRVERVGPVDGELGAFGTLIAFLGPPPSGRYREWMHEHDESGLLGLAERLHREDRVSDLAALAIDRALEELWPVLATSRGEHAEAADLPQGRGTPHAGGEL